ncbi:ADP-ribosylglycohydrolase family protein [Candidatus Laterigemmans baculatus]|uniref:ADP-ribosylglycohydrolase family protein n=1 Tax=Candidatus Laterigemmans baculatus TaxID=2770505 RepID=UPI0013D9DC99|nr:ADP-ribosylglycohydrolase family protein [Candidatus Laterigemmans baculatus]
MSVEAIAGCILSTAVGDALGLPYEGVSRDRAPRLLGPPTRHRFLFGRGMISDDTEHTLMVAQSLIEAGDDADDFAHRLAWRLRWWILALPAGVGKAKARSGIKLWLGASPTTAGVFSAGNGPAMRAAILGAVFDDRDTLLRFTKASSRLTHTDPKAEAGAIAVALAAQASRAGMQDPSHFLQSLTECVGEEASELVALVRQASESVSAGESTRALAASLGLEKGVTGYTYHTVPVVIHAWLSHPTDYATAVTAVIECGGDADTTAAIVGGIVGAGVGREGIPKEWVYRLCEWPRSVRWMARLAQQLAEVRSTSAPAKAISVNPVAVLPRNLLFLAVVLVHGFRRLAPPY